MSFKVTLLMMELIHVLILLQCPGLMADNKWSMTVPEVVHQNFGEDAILPCTFTTPYADYQDNIKVIWRTLSPFKGPVLFCCLSKGNSSESEQNCTQSTGRYSLSGDPRKHNISLRINNVLFADSKQYFCRFELSKQGDNFVTETGTRLNVRVPQTLESIYVRMLPSGEQFVTCDVKGTPPPAVIWITPEHMDSSLVSVQSIFASASSSIPANLTNTNYTCQIQGENGLQHLSMYYSGAQEQQQLQQRQQPQQIPFMLFIAFVILAGVFLTLFLVILAVLYKKGSSESLDAAKQMTATKDMITEEDFQEEIYANV